MRSTTTWCARQSNISPEEEKQVGGQLGRPSGARFRTYERLKRYAEEVKDTLFDTEPLRQGDRRYLSLSPAPGCDRHAEPPTAKRASPMRQPGRTGDRAARGRPALRHPRGRRTPGTANHLLAGPDRSQGQLRHGDRPRTERDSAAPREVRSSSHCSSRSWAGTTADENADVAVAGRSLCSRSDRPKAGHGRV